MRSAKISFLVGTKVKKKWPCDLYSWIILSMALIRSIVDLVGVGTAMKTSEHQSTIVKIKL